MKHKIEPSKIAAWIGAIGATAMLVIGFAHFPMGYVVTGLQDFSSLPPNAADFVIMLCMVIGLLLVTLAILSYYFLMKLKTGEATARVFFLCTGLAVLGRTLIEVLHPIALPDPDWTNTLSFFLLSLTFLAPAILAQAYIKPNQQ
ncbi:MAG: hypothetical protein JXA13_15230 [Anaerolineales bacterium]|nr:hypothetical protein [Anaerolineales bacterium]